MRTILFLLIMVPSYLSAAPLYCSGAIKNTYVSNSGSVFIKGDWRNDYTRICKLDGTLNGIDSMTCSMWSSFAATAISKKLKMTVSFFADNGDTCANLPTYDATPKTRYVMLWDETSL
jgi:hypothetical protein